MNERRDPRHVIEWVRKQVDEDDEVLVSAPAVRVLIDELDRLRAQANCGEGHDPQRICCAHAADVKRLRAAGQHLADVIVAGSTGTYTASCVGALERWNAAVDGRRGRVQAGTTQDTAVSE